MKKITVLFILINLFAIFSFTSCDLLFGNSGGFVDKGSDEEDIINENAYTSKMITTGTMNAVYLAQVNTTAMNVPNTNVAYVDDVYTAIFADDDLNNEENFATEKSFEQFLYEQDLELQNSIDLTNSRAASGDTPTYDTKDYEIGDTKIFYSQHAQNSKQYDEITTRCVYNKYNGNDSQCYVFVNSSEDNPEISGLYKNLGDIFNREYETITSVLGSPKYNEYLQNVYVPCSKKIFILLTDIFNDKNENTNNGVILGYFSSADLFTERICSKNGIKANQCEMFYIDSWALENMELQTYSTLFHEFNHMLNYVNKTLKSYNIDPNNVVNNEIWYTEMLSMIAEDYIEERLGIAANDIASTKARLGTFNENYNKGFLNWNIISNSLTAYANTYAYGAYLVRNFGGLELLKELAQNSFGNIESITAALQKVNPDCYYIIDDTKQKIDFMYTLRNFYNILLNIDEPESVQNNSNLDERYFTLNVSKDYDSEKHLGFEAIDLNNLVFKSGGNNYRYKVPQIGSAGYNQRKSIGPGGFLVQKVANSNCHSFKLNYKLNQIGILEYYLIRY